MQNKEQEKQRFAALLQDFVHVLNTYVSTDDGQWTIKGFIDTYKNIYTISSDTKVISKILEIHLFPKIIELASRHGYHIVLAEHQNYYPDFSFVHAQDERIKFAVDLKTTYRLPKRPDFCNGFTLGSHGEYFKNRTSQKNIQFPYGDYLGHYCLGIIYTRTNSSHDDERTTYPLDALHAITSVIRDFQFFVAEKWRIASDKGGSGNTANIGSITYIPDILSGNGMFRNLGESWFDDYWMNYNVITMSIEGGSTRTIRRLEDFVKYRGGNPEQIVTRPTQRIERRDDS